MRYSVKVEKSGRILIPAAVRRQLHLVEGQSHVLLTVDAKGIKVGTRRQALEEVRSALRRYIPEGSDVAAELLADRRREAEREDKA
ncbi:MAG TPA: AbrB/MazE/SpoVT family DNA-binding domain-containing protein [Bryobacteraceae bacterium]|nr:AbrB/MazE/SpoVT family DNA-binding domain-containing protein [Bryobacteraceae bacterium]